jgi:hypothetical protein
VSVHSLAFCSLIEARLVKGVFSINADRFGYALPFASNSLPKLCHFRLHFPTIAISASDISGEVKCLTTMFTGRAMPLGIH